MSKQYLVATILTSDGAEFIDFQDDISVSDTSLESDEMFDLVNKWRAFYFEKNNTLVFPTNGNTVRIINCSQITSVDLEVISEEEFFTREEERQKAIEKRKIDQQNYEKLLKDSRDSFEEFYNKVNNKK